MSSASAGVQLCSCRWGSGGCWTRGAVAAGAAAVCQGCRGRAAGPTVSPTERGRPVPGQGVGPGAAGPGAGAVPAADRARPSIGRHGGGGAAPRGPDRGPIEPRRHGRCAARWSCRPCHLRHRLDLAKAEAPSIILRGSYLRVRAFSPAVAADPSLNLERIPLRRWGRLCEAHIGGQLDCTGAVFTNPEGQALNADGLIVDGDMFLGGAVHRRGAAARRPHRRPAGLLGASFTNPEGRRPDRRRAGRRRRHVPGQAQCTGEVRLPAPTSAASWTAPRPASPTPTATALNADRLAVDGDMVLAGAVHRRGAAGRRPHRRPAGLHARPASPTPTARP